MKLKKIILCILISLSIICILSGSVFADWNEIYNPSDVFNTPVSNIKTTMAYVGAACAVIMLVYMGIKFFLASPDDQADLKKELPLWVIGCVLLFTPKLLDILKDTVNNIRTTSDSTDINGVIKEGSGIVLGGFTAVGASLAVIIMVYIGIKYMIESPEGKAVLKKRIPTYVIAAALVFTAPQIVEIVINFAKGL